MLLRDKPFESGFQMRIALQDQKHAFHREIRRNLTAVVDGNRQWVAVALENGKRRFVDGFADARGDGGGLSQEAGGRDAENENQKQSRKERDPFKESHRLAHTMEI